MLCIIKENVKFSSCLSCLMNFKTIILFNELKDINKPKCLFYHLDFRNGSCHFSAPAYILRSRSNVEVLEFMGPTKIVSFVVASLCIFDIRTV